MHFQKIARTAAFGTALSLVLTLVPTPIGANERESSTSIEEEETTTTEDKTESTTEKKTETTTTEKKTTSTTEKKKNHSSSTAKKTEKKTEKKDQKKDKKDAKKDQKEIDPKKVEDIKDTKKQKEEKLNVTIIPKVYNDHGIEMKNKKETINGYIYFNQGDAAWNDNGYQIKRAGCGPTSMAVVISSLTGKWVTPVDTTVWAYEHGYYSSAGSDHGLIPALAKQYSLNCEGVGTNASKIRTALKAGNPVVCLMGPGYFTKGGHFMVLVGIDNNDNVTVADVGSRQRSQYKYKLTDVISQSKAASAGGPFWVISNPNAKKAKEATTSSKKATSQISGISNISYEAMKDVNEALLEKTVKEGKIMMVMTDKKIIKGEEFLYVTAVDKKHMATVMDKDFKTKKQYSVQELFQHVNDDNVTGVSFWKVSGEYKFVMPIASKSNSVKKTSTKNTKSTSVSGQSQ